MTTTSDIGIPAVLPAEALTEHEAEAVMAGAFATQADVAAIEVAGSGAISCLQGLLTNDLEEAGDDGFRYGAVLTAKGMIVCDMWTARVGGHAHLSVPLEGKEALLALFKRFLPPRLAHPKDRSDHLAVLRVAGPQGITLAERAGIPVPGVGTSTDAVMGEAACVVSRPTEGADFGLQIQLEQSRAAKVLQSLAHAGATVTSPAALELARILTGWPRLGAEIDDKTLPQEVRFDTINGVSYTKGCYTGQETVARLHFRGHTNKEMVGLTWEGTIDQSDPAITQDDRPVGRVTSAAWLAPFQQYVGLGIVRRQTKRDRPVMAASSPAEVVRLPFELQP
jgi:folate-binding protein YgfZ